MRSIQTCLMALAIIALPGIAAAKEWKTEKTVSLPWPAYCPSLAAMIENRVAAVRRAKAALKKSEDDTPDNMLDLANKWMGDTRPTAKQVEKQNAIEKDAAEIRDLNARYGNEKCGSIDVDQKMALELQPGDTPVTELKSHETKFKVK